MSGITAFRIQWIVGFLLWGAIFTFIDIAVRRVEFTSADPAWLQWAVRNAAVLLTVVAYAFLVWRNRRLEPVLGVTFVAFTGGLVGRIVFVSLLILAAGVGAAGVRLLVGQPAFPPLGPKYLFLLVAIAGLVWVMSPPKKIESASP
jgi:hypothetical protein